MINEEAYNAIVKDIKRGAELDMITARSWKKVGKNYATRKDGKPFADPAMAFKGMDGIREIHRSKKWDGWHVELINAEGRAIDITGLHLPEIEDAIEHEIEYAEEDYNYRTNLIAHLHEICERFDNALTAAFATFSDNPIQREATALTYFLGRYISASVQDNFNKHAHGFTEKEEQKIA